ncbi:MAG: TIR domain-containing protein [Leptospiraceae bacterium]|nr:TIR domain-containing protein [Leptospiraceae bacterium]
MNKLIFKEITAISRPLLYTKYKNVNVQDLLTKETIAKAKARILTGDFEDNGEYTQNYRLEDNLKVIEEPDDETIVKKLLIGLLNIRRNMPATYKGFDFECEGFCLILGIDVGRFNFIRDLLLEQGFIAETENKAEFQMNPLYLTAKGYEQVQKINKRTVTMKGSENSDQFDYDVVISFAGEDRLIAEEIVKELKERKISIFYDTDPEADLWGKDLYAHLAYIYGKAGKYCIMILSQNYAQKLWTNHERQNAQARAFREKREYILPIRLDSTEIPGIAETIGYIEYNNSPSEIADKVLIKLSKLSQ